MQNDNRLYNIHDLIYREEYFSGIKTLEHNTFPQLDKLIEWFVNFLFANLNTNSKYTFSKNLFSITENELFKQGDLFYKSLFYSENLILEKFKEDEVDNPLTLVYTNSFNHVFDEKQSNDTSLFIYSQFQKWLNEKIAVQVANDNRLNSFETIVDVYDKTYSLYAYLIKDTDFYHVWIDNIKASVIQKEIQKIKTLPINKKIYELAETRMLARDKLQVEEHHLGLINKNKEKSVFEFILNSTKSSDLILFSSEMSIANILLIRTSYKAWLEWLINIPYPILQDHAYFIVNEISTYRKIIDSMLSSFQFNQNNYILILTLKNYFDLICKVTENLEYIEATKQDEKRISDILSKEIEQNYNNWINTELQAEFTWLFDKLFPINKNILSFEYFYDVLEWITSYTESSIIGNRKQAKGLSKVFELFQKEFQSRLNQISNRKEFINNIPIEKLNWQYFKCFVELLDKNFAIEYAETIKQKYTTFILSEQFKWIRKFEKHSINCAYKFAFVLSKLNSSFKIWKEIYSQTEIHYEGWKVSKTYDYQLLDKEIYVLLVGVGLSYILFEDKQLTDAKKMFNEILNITIQQYRLDKTKELRYSVPLNFLAVTAAKYDTSTTKSFVDTLISKADDIEIILECINRVISENKIEINDEEQKRQIIGFINTNDDLLRYKYRDRTQSKTLEYYKKLKQLIINEFV